MAYLSCFGSLVDQFGKLRIQPAIHDQPPREIFDLPCMQRIERFARIQITGIVRVMPDTIFDEPRAVESAFLANSAGHHSVKHFPSPLNLNVRGDVRKFAPVDGVCQAPMHTFYEGITTLDEG
jgi:hypothetical protein